MASDAAQSVVKHPDPAVSAQAPRSRAHLVHTPMSTAPLQVKPSEQWVPAAYPGRRSSPHGRCRRPHACYSQRESVYLHRDTQSARSAPSAMYAPTRAHLSYVTPPMHTLKNA